MSTEKYVNFISEQIRKERTTGFRPFRSADINEAAMEVHGDPDDDSYKHIDKIHAHIKAAGHTIHHDDDGPATKDPHVTAHYERGDDRKTGNPSGFTIHPKAHGDKKLMTMAKGFRKMYAEQAESLQEAKLSLKDAKSTLAKHVGISKEFQHTLDDSHEHVGTSKEGHHVFYIHHESTADHDAGHGYTVVHPNGKITDHTVHGEKPDSDGSSDPSKVPNRKDMDNSKHHAGSEVHHLTPSTKDTMHKAAKKNAPDFED